ncbi:MAG: DUF6176 family protein [Oscillospiraceae bacterium]|nr:DUF6176 family protein [Oscillospiraceae bacterium]
MDMVLWRARISSGKEDLAREWIAFLDANKEAGNETLKNEKEHLELYFTNTENGKMYLYLFVLADDLDYAGKTALESDNPLDKRHFEYLTACVDMEDCTQIKPALALGDFSVFE